MTESWGGCPTRPDPHRGQPLHSGTLLVSIDLWPKRCRGCGRLRHPPRPMCPYCHSLDFEIVDLDGEGVVYSYVILHHPQNPAFEYPIIAALWWIWQEGVRVVSNLVDTDPAEIAIGMPVTVDYRTTRSTKGWCLCSSHDRKRMNRQLQDATAIVGIGQTEFSKAAGRSETQLAAEAILAALEDAGLATERC